MEELEQELSKIKKAGKEMRAQKGIVEGHDATMAELKEKKSLLQRQLTRVTEKIAKILKRKDSEKGASDVATGAIREGFLGK